MTLKHELLQTAATLSLSSTNFRAVGITEWEPIMKRVEDKFVSARYDKVLWWWNGYLKGPVHSVLLPGWPVDSLHKLIPLHEQVWFIAEDDKFWLFEGNIESIQQVLAESHSFEYYLVSKKYEWLLCENHHDVLFGVGEIIIEKLKQVERELSK
ncbi:DUF6756 family protein [Hymenobacter negativus]|uniref:Uncharacterized protein n=1 Tax=Hymenobacter negativus TaxID=2795026 RepID=A0ABS0Q4Y8_9BACT|nr:DUF6756 family protein [Hymenobacter negativus]MBH8557319.1 hypothetical protein [Hymenobacter negativus]